MLHKSYQEIRHHPCDFKVQYRFYTAEEGGRKTLPCQGYYRCDWAYKEDIKDNKSKELFMIHTEFEDKKGNLLMDKTISVDREGIARMWILIPERRTLHQNRIKIDTKGYFMEGSKRVADCTVIEVVGLFNNPIKS